MTQEELTTERTKVLGKMEAIASIPVNENRLLTKEEQQDFDALHQKDETLERQLKAMKRGNQGNESAYVLRGDAVSKKGNHTFDVMEIVRAGVEGVEMTGFNAEAMQEWKCPQISQAGNRIIPWQALAHLKREGDFLALTTGSNDGGEWVDDQFSTPVLPLYANLASSMLGVRRLMGVMNDVEFPVFKRNGQKGAFLAETATTSELSPTTDAVKTSAHRLGGFAKISKKLILTTGNIDAQAWLGNFLRQTLVENEENAIWNGTGTNNQPTGLLASLGATETIASGGTNGDPLSRAKTLAAVSKVAQANALMEGMDGFAINPIQEFKARNVLVDSGSGKFLLEMGMLDERPFASTTLLPATGSKGSNSTLSTIAYSGNWQDLVVVNYGSGVEILIDPYSAAKTSEVTLHAECFFDTKVLRKESFVKLTELV